jgi:Cu-Zn family superoxide dismutase
MTHVKTLCLVAAMTAGLLCAGCKNENTGTSATTKPGAASADKSAKATIKSSKDAQDKGMNISGTVEFNEQADGVRVVVDVKGLTPGKHGFHIHEKGDLSEAKLMSAGAHFNPGGHTHGGPDAATRHAGDLGNLEADAEGNAKLDKVFKGLTIKGATDGIVGRSVIIHADADDLTTDPSGKSGDRIAGGVIEAGAK